MNKKILAVVLSLAVLVCVRPVAGMTPESSDNAQSPSQCKAAPLSVSEIAHYQQLQSTAEAKGLLGLGGRGLEEIPPEAWIIFGVVVTVSLVVILATAG